MATPDGHGRLEISRFRTPPAIADHRAAPVHSRGYLCAMFAVEDIGRLGYDLSSQIVVSIVCIYCPEADLKSVDSLFPALLSKTNSLVGKHFLACNL